MKLKTILRENGPRGRAIVDYIEGSEVDHDAAAAHALMQAMDEVSKYLSTPDGYASAVDAIAAIRQRAFKLMAEWGFDSGEVE